MSGFEFLGKSMCRTKLKQQPSSLLGQFDVTLILHYGPGGSRPEYDQTNPIWQQSKEITIIIKILNYISLAIFDYILSVIFFHKGFNR